MRPIHWAAVVVGLAATVWGVKLMLSDPPARSEPAPLAAPGGGGAAPDAPRGAQVELLDGPPLRKTADDDRSAMGGLRPSAAVEAERRRHALAEVLQNLDNSPVYVEGVDGPAPETAPKRPRR